nr:AAA family ATPase [uncultured Neokomagataea sp.]
MIVTKFKSKKLNGYLDFNIKFNYDKNFLIGINGCGKTSVLKSIMGLISPDIDWIMNTDYKFIKIDIKINGEKKRIFSYGTEKGRSIGIFSGKREKIQTTISFDAYKTMPRRSHDLLFEEDREFISLRESLVNIPADDATIRYIRKLPSPIFLGLDRSNLPFSVGPRENRRRSAGRRSHATLRSFLDESVELAEQAASRARIRANIERQGLASQLREDILLTLFEDIPSRSMRVPKESDIKRIEKYRKSIKQAFKVLGLNQEKISEKVDPFFNNTIASGSDLLKFKDFSEIFNVKQDDSLKSFSKWVESQPRIALFDYIEKLLTNFNNNEKRIFNETDSYLSILNRFFIDSGKEIIFDDSGTIKIKIMNTHIKDVSVLSSGERQLFVLITTLIFGEEDQKSGVLIIDEPELSLHLKWQEMFVEAIVQANPEIQLILATHSPSIILDDDIYCVDVKC